MATLAAGTVVTGGAVAPASAPSKSTGVSPVAVAPPPIHFWG